LVVKPLDGAGSQATYLLNDQQTLDALLVNLPIHHGRERSWRIETFQEGDPVSVLALCGPAVISLLPTCYQRIKFGTTIKYHGGAYPLPAGLSWRAECIARYVLASLPEPSGFIGIDMVLGDDLEGREDSVIEVNPRLTTSYVVLRAASRTNLAQALLDVAAGKPPDLSFDETPLEFDPDGTVRPLECDPGAPGLSLSFSIDHSHNTALQANPHPPEIQSGPGAPGPHSKL
jgi:predicted ATP-grasp superfamily ATP-dependent carboligase